MSKWLLDRLMEVGQPKPRFAFQGTVNWMRALAVLVDDDSFTNTSLENFYKRIKRRPVDRNADTMAYENMLMAIHNHASLVNINANTSHPYDTCRSAIVSWYYSVYFACSAMVAAETGVKQDTHSLTARVWQNELVQKGRVVGPFSLTLPSIIKADVDQTISNYRQDNKYDLNCYAENKDQAWGAVISYLNGSASYEQWRAEEKVKSSKDFKRLGVDSFRGKAAREMRDKMYAKSGVNFLAQAFRYRGKANYRDSIFLSYGDDNIEKIINLTQDLLKVSEVFHRMASYHIRQRVEKGSWDDFVSDIKINSRLSIDLDRYEI